ncbi:hypothetical protein BDW27_1154 [Nocardiopsis sp. L17-MgMaSL7]|nr:hypothetical protein BDW27_1154 [Nocardiopsis sp. L17-MgMaSL7]
MDPGQTNYNPTQLAAKRKALIRELPVPTAPLTERKKPANKPCTAKRLKPHAIDELIAAFQVGTNVHKLEERFDITRKRESNISKATASRYTSVT